MNVILIAVISLGAIALVAAVILYVASKKFAVYEDPRIAQVAAVLPQANCGGCGYPGNHIHRSLPEAAQLPLVQFADLHTRQISWKPRKE